MKFKQHTLNMPYALAVSALLVFILTLSAQEPKDVERGIDLAKIGYPRPPCDYMFQEDVYAKTHIEFLDSAQILVSFPADISNCDQRQGYGTGNASRLRSAVIDLSGNVLHSLDWKSSEDVQAGTDGHIFLTTGREIRILANDFSLLQSLPDERPRAPKKSLILSPSRHGFAMRYYRDASFRASYFEGSPAKKTQEADDCYVLVVVDSGFLCRDQGEPEHFTPHVNSTETPLDSQVVNALTRGLTEDTPDYRWIIPGWGAWISRVQQTPSASGRILYVSTGNRFPITDTTGFGYFLRAAVVDVVAKRMIFRKQYNIDSDVALSPDGHWLAVREKTRLILHKL